MKSMTWKRDQFQNRKWFIRICSAEIKRDYIATTKNLEKMRDRYPDATAGVDIDGIIHSRIERFTRNTDWISRKQFQSVKHDILVDVYDRVRMDIRFSEDESESEKVVLTHLLAYIKSEYEKLEEK